MQHCPVGLSTKPWLISMSNPHIAMVPICSIDKFRCTRAFCFLTSLNSPLSFCHHFVCLTARWQTKPVSHQVCSPALHPSHCLSAQVITWATSCCKLTLLSCAHTLFHLPAIKACVHAASYSQLYLLYYFYFCAGSYRAAHCIKLHACTYTYIYTHILSSPFLSLRLMQSRTPSIPPLWVCFPEGRARGAKEEWKRSGSAWAWERGREMRECVCIYMYMCRHAIWYNV